MPPAIPTDFKPEVDQIVEAILYLYTESRRLTKELARSVDLTGPQLTVLKMLEGVGDLSLSELSERIRGIRKTGYSGERIPVVNASGGIGPGFGFTRMAMGGGASVNGALGARVVSRLRSLRGRFCRLQPTNPSAQPPAPRTTPRNTRYGIQLLEVSLSLAATKSNPSSKKKELLMSLNIGR